MMNTVAKREVINDFLNYIEDFDNTSLTIIDYDCDVRFSISVLENTAVEASESALIISHSDVGTFRIKYNDISLIFYIEGDKAHILRFHKNSDSYVSNIM